MAREGSLPHLQGSAVFSWARSCPTSIAYVVPKDQSTSEAFVSRS